MRPLPIEPHRVEPHLVEPLSDLALATAYGKTHRLDVPVFESARKYYRLRMEDVVRPACSLARGEESRLARVACTLARAMTASARYEPLNTVPLHRTYPSPRSLFPIEVDFVFEGKSGGDARFCFDADHVALYPLDGAMPQNAASPSRLRLDLVADLRPIAPLYCDLAPTLCALEAGHLLDVLFSELRAAQFRVRTSLAAAPAGSIGDRVTLASIEFPSDLMVCPGNHDFNDSIRITVPCPNERDDALIRKAKAYFQCRPAGEVELDEALLCGPVSSGMRFRRSSGLFPFGYHGVALSSHERDEATAALAANSPPAPDHAETPGIADLWPSVTFLLPQSSGDLVVQRIGHADQGIRRVTDGCTLLSEAYGTAYNINLLTIPLIIVFSSDFGAMLQDAPAWRYAQSLVLTGILAQKYCVDCAQFDLFARPFRGMVEDKIERVAGLAGQVTYSILVGRSRASNPGFATAPWSLRAPPSGAEPAS